MLRGSVVPEGQRVFAPAKARIDNLVAVHDNENFLNGMKKRGASEAQIEGMREQYPPATHPVVRTHPVSGCKSLYVNKTFTRTIKGMDENEAQPLLQQLYHQAWIPDYRGRWANTRK